MNEFTIVPGTITLPPGMTEEMFYKELKRHALRLAKLSNPPRAKTRTPKNGKRNANRTGTRKKKRNT